MTRRVVLLTIALVALAAVASPAQAALLMNDPAAMAAWQGSQRFTASDGINTLDVRVEYAVYAPGQYTGTDPSGGSDYVYAYQLFSDVNAETVESGAFTVGIADGAIVRNATVETASLPGQAGGVAPMGASVSASSVRWFFMIDPVDFGEWSAVLLYSSPYRPQWISASTIDGGLSRVEPMPSPTPEPATLALLATGGLLAVGRRALRRRAV